MILGSLLQRWFRTTHLFVFVDSLLPRSLLLPVNARALFDALKGMEGL